VLGKWKKGSVSYTKIEVRGGEKGRVFIKKRSVKEK